MKRSGGDVQLSRVRRARRATRHGDDGLGVVEILAAFVVFMICFVPLLQLFPEGQTVITQSADQRLAASVANSTLQNYQNSIVPPTFSSATTPAPSWQTPVFATATNVAPSWAAATRTSTTQSGVTFEIYTIGGWCRTSVAPGNGTVLASDQPSYHIVVKIGWGKQGTANSTSQVVVDSTELSSVTGAPTATTPATVLVECPLGLT
jgi:hypothetical protein